jgi:AcrR family transcriptional regulator
MPKDKSDTYKKIIPAAKKEFLSKGFEKASMRTIASEAGISAAGLYRHFADKEAMFEALLEPLFQKFEVSFQKQRERDYAFLENNSLDDMWKEPADLSLFMELVYGNYEEFKLLVCCSQGTRHGDFIHDFVTMEQKETLEFLEAARSRGISVKEMVPKELHLLLSAYYTAVFEVVVHDFSKEEAKHYLDTLQMFFYPGWRAVLGL